MRADSKAARTAAGACDEEQEMLAWLGQRLASGGNKPDLWLGYGASGRFASAIGVLAEALPADRVRRIDGGHDRPTWRALWTLLLDARPFGEY